MARTSKTEPPKTRAKKSATKSPTQKRIGRPPLSEPRVTISFRVPEDVQEAFIQLAQEETQASPGRKIKPSELYNHALALFLKERGHVIEGWNG